MKVTQTTSALIASALVITWAASFAQQGPPQDRPEPQDRAQAERGQMDRDRDFDRDMDRDRLRDPDRADDPAQDRDRDQDRIHAPDFARLSDDDIYGREVMSSQERDEYRMQLQAAVSAEERQRIEAQHRETVLARARAQGVDLAPPGKGIYGGALMSVEERNQYREQLRTMSSDEERRRFVAEHREAMQQRARAQGVPFEDLEETEDAE